MRGLTIFACMIGMSILLSGCSHFNQGKSTLEEANAFFNQGRYQASLEKYEEVVAKYPPTGDLALFEMGIIYSHPKNDKKDYQKSLECFQKVITSYPTSAFRQDSEMMMFYIRNVIMKDRMIATKQTEIDALQQEVKSKSKEIDSLYKNIEAQEQRFFRFVLQNGTADKILIEKKERRLQLFSKGEVLKTYKIALGADAFGPKESIHDNKTPEGNYIIDSKNKNSLYHLSLHISYPNERDKKRAKELGVSPGGDIMIHGLKNGYSSVGAAHAEVDWTKGCIAVTDQEIEEIYQLVRNGTAVEIRP